MADFLPSKKFILIFTLLIVAGGGFWVYKNHFSQKADLIYDPPAAVKGTTASTGNADLDSDADGLKDWQEKLFGTDLNNPDTDNDGVLDGDEQLGEAGLDSSIGSASDPAFGGDSKTVSQKFIQDVISGYLALRSSGLDDDSIFEVLLTKFQDDYAGVKLLTDSYKKEDVTVAADNPEEIRRYANSVADILDSDFKDFNRNELALFNEIAGSDYPDPELLALFEKYEFAYNSAAERLKAIPTPVAYVYFHADLVNGFRNLAIINGVFKNIQSDPLNAALFIAPYIKEARRFQDVMNNIASRLAEDNIPFLPDDGGKTLLSYSVKTN